MVATGIGQAMTDNTELLRKISGIAIIGLGVFMAATIFVPALNFEKRSRAAGAARRRRRTDHRRRGVRDRVDAVPRPDARRDPHGRRARSSILLQGAVLLFFYSAGLAVPFIASALGVGAMTSAIGLDQAALPAAARRLERDPDRHRRADPHRTSSSA